jgi:hypothetical protein
MAITALEAALIETWTLFAIGSITIILRVFCRTKMVGVAGWHADDYMIFFGWVRCFALPYEYREYWRLQGCYATMTVAAHIVGGTGDTSHLTMKQRLSFTPEQAAARQKGTKWFMVGWYSYIGLIWTLKLNMLFLFRRVATTGWVNRFIVPVMVFVGSTAIAIWILLASACRPFHKLWQILPDPGSKYLKAWAGYGAWLTFDRILHAAKPGIFDNYSGVELDDGFVHHPHSCSYHHTAEDFLGSQVWTSDDVLRRYLRYDCGDLASLLRSRSKFDPTYHFFHSYWFIPQLEKGETAAIWSCREDVVAIIIGQATMVRPIFTRRFWSDNPGSSTGYSSNKRSDGNESLELSGKLASDSKGSRLGFRPVKDPYNVSVLRTECNESEERIVETGPDNDLARASASQTSDRGRQRTRSDIVVETEVEVLREKGSQGHHEAWKAV